MCFSFESSMRAWFIALIGSISLLIISKDKLLGIWISIFTLTFTQIQIIEALIWKSFETDSKADVSNIAQYIPILLWSQPLIQSLLGYIYTKNNTLLVLTFIYLIIITMELGTNDDYDITISNNGHLVWHRYRNSKEIFILGDYLIYIPLYLIGLIGSLFLIPNERFVTKYSLISFAILSLLYSTRYETNEFNSMWCYVAIGYILVANLSELI